MNDLPPDQSGGERVSFEWQEINDRTELAEGPDGRVYARCRVCGGTSHLGVERRLPLKMWWRTIVFLLRHRHGSPADGKTQTG